MKKLLSLILVLAILVLSGCGSKDTVSKDKGDKTKTDVAEVEEPKDPFLKMMSTNDRPLAVMIDNDGPSSRPQCGLENAYMVYEIIVEGGATRMMAIFKNPSEIEKVGPIRSSRHYFLDYAVEHDAIYTHAGWSPKAGQDMKLLGVNNINGIQGNDGVHFYRDNTYDNTWHNLYTDIWRVLEYADVCRHYERTTETKHLPYNEKDTALKGEAADATEISLPYSTMYTVNYKYDAEKKMYTRYIGQKEHMLQNGEPISAKNIIVYQVRNFNLPDTENKGRQDLETVGNGTGYYITNGKAVEITWSKSDRKAQTEYKLADGTELKLNPGNTYVQILPVTSQITVN